MKIPKFFHPILGVMAGAILFLTGIAILTIVFVGMVKAANYAAPYFAEVVKGFHLLIHKILSL
ncbi:hypothetical protein ED375_12375 [Muribaculaceae bacterium Isolate-004 (NCI)]|jgi:hypothetical protein|uniref:hypothetical protein n=1 Tax=uncultured Muribaculum sp. TaxID=1918613 RepID=UPI000FFF6493|nr:hypothetical protein ED375_12375 [Muribaculaceae bacterium Isolate-004 (NCI)]RXE64810.1 hypothetical protein ED328_15385 [Muribaculaceae bacterium Isolate-001 (NCI)]